MYSVTLVYPWFDYQFNKTPYMPLGLGYLVSALRKNSKHELSFELIDGNIRSKSSVYSRLENSFSDIYLISCTLMQVPQVEIIVNTIRKNNPKSLILLGGAGPTSLFYANIHYEYGAVDAIVIGEAETIIASLVDLFLETGNTKLFKSKHPLYRCLSASRTTLKAENFSVEYLPNRGIFDVETYLNVWKESAGMTSLHTIGSRGCCFSCNFCDKSVTGRIIRNVACPLLKAELATLCYEYSPDDVFFFDDLFTTSMRRVNQVCDITSQLNFSGNFSAQGRINTVTHKMLERMFTSGFDEIFFGVESGSQRILDFFNKQISVEQITKVFDMCHDVGIRAGAYFIVGVPGEIQKDLDDTLRLIERIRPSLLNISCLTPFPNTPLFRETSHLIREWDFSKWDDFRSTVYSPSCFNVDPSVTMALIEKRYRELVVDDEDFDYSQYQFAND